MTDTTLPADMARTASDLGHEELTEVVNSYVPTWECRRCYAITQLTSTQGWSGWATEYTCDRVRALR